MSVPVTTSVSKENIQRYYEHVGSLAATQTLGPRPSKLSVDGSSSYSPCDYCELKVMCDAYESDYQVWLDQVTAIIGSPQGDVK
jgi:hypothetical protein